MSVSEFSLIERYFSPLGATTDKVAEDKGIALGIGDDCALLDVPAGHQLAVSIDTLVEGVHFLPDTPAEDVASRVFGACLSDLAAMGATPAWITLALSLPDSNGDWLQAFSERLAQQLQQFDVALVGGDTTRGPLTISLQVHGWVPRGEALCRHSANAGDWIFVSGTLGDSAAGLDQLQNGGDNAFLIDRFQQPQPRISTGLAIRPYASSAIDISDGLLADLGHILERSELGAVIETEKLPLSVELRQQYPTTQAQQWALSGGEDFELCFTVPAQNLEAFQQALADHPVPLTCIGQLQQKAGLYLQDRAGNQQAVEAKGFKHF